MNWKRLSFHEKNGHDEAQEQQQRNVDCEKLNENDGARGKPKNKDATTQQAERQEINQTAERNTKTVVKYKWKCPMETCKRKRKAYGYSENGVQERVRCSDCKAYFRTSNSIQEPVEEETRVELYVYACPACGQQVKTTIANGTVHVAHKTSTGNSCKKQFRVSNGRQQ